MSKDRAINRCEDIFNELLNLAISRFTWSNLPYGLTSEQLEFMLLDYGQLLGFEDKTKGLMILPAYAEKEFNVYGLPIFYNVNSLNGKYNETIDIDNGVLLRNNPMGTGDLYKLSCYAERLDKIEKTEDVNLFQQNIPKLILTDDNSSLSAKNIIDKLEKYNFCIVGKKSLTDSISTSNVLDTSSPYLLDKLSDYKQVLISEILTYLGIKNNNVFKKERVVSDEVNANNEFTLINIDLMYDMRNRFCEEFNNKFGTNITVEKREVELNEQLHSSTERDNRE